MRTQRLLVLALLCAAALWSFAEIASEVVEGETQTFDEWVLKSLRQPDDPADSIGPRWLEEMGRDVTALGGFAVLTLLTLIVSGYLMIIRNGRALIFLLVTTLGALLLSTLFKEFFARPRPDIVTHLSYVTSYSFPSGHSVLSAAVYLANAVLLARLTPNLVAKVYFVAVALSLSFLVGLSRVYLGVHYATDVFGGWTLGAAWGLFCWFGADIMLRRRPTH